MVLLYTLKPYNNQNSQHSRFALVLVLMNIYPYKPSRIMQAFSLGLTMKMHLLNFMVTGYRNVLISGAKAWHYNTRQKTPDLPGIS